MSQQHKLAAPSTFRCSNDSKNHHRTDMAKNDPAAKSQQHNQLKRRVPDDSQHNAAGSSTDYFNKSNGREARLTMLRQREMQRMQLRQRTMQVSTNRAGDAASIQEDEIPLRERDTIGCMVWKTVGELGEEKKNHSIENYFQQTCSTTEFARDWMEKGFQNPVFKPNKVLSQERRTKFTYSLADLPQDACFGVVFHGTPTANIAPILLNGLDPTRRRGQSFGPGEYFSKTPETSVSYCRGGLEMLVFVVVLPSTNPRPKDEVGLPASRNEAWGRSYYDVMGNVPIRKRAQGGLSMYNSMQTNYVVVENNAHQIPIGTLTFTSVNRYVLTESQRKAQILKQLNDNFALASKAAIEAKTKAKIIQYLIASRADVASEWYKKYEKTLLPTSKREISWYVHQKVDKDVIFCYFEDLPEPMEKDEFNKADIPSVDQVCSEELQAKASLDKAKKENKTGVIAPSPFAAPGLRLSFGSNQFLPPAVFPPRVGPPFGSNQVPAAAFPPPSLNAAVPAPGLPFGSNQLPAATLSPPPPKAAAPRFGHSSFGSSNQFPAAPGFGLSFGSTQLPVAATGFGFSFGSTQLPVTASPPATSGMYVSKDGRDNKNAEESIHT